MPILRYYGTAERLWIWCKTHSDNRPNCIRCSLAKREHGDAISRFQVEWDRLQKRRDAMCIDQPDARIEEGFYTVGCAAAAFTCHAKARGTVPLTERNPWQKPKSVPPPMCPKTV